MPLTWWHALATCPCPSAPVLVPLLPCLCPCCKLYIDIDIEIVIDILKMSYDDMLWQPVPAPVSCPCLCPCAVSHMMTCFGNQSLLMCPVPVFVPVLCLIWWHPLATCPCTCALLCVCTCLSLSLCPCAASLSACHCPSPVIPAPTPTKKNIRHALQKIRKSHPSGISRHPVYYYIA